MKKLIILLINILIITANLNIVYGNTSMEMSERIKDFPTDEERMKVQDTNNFNIYINGENTGETISILGFIPYEGDYMPLRDFVEKLGGKIEWDPYYDIETEYYGYLGWFELFGTKYTYESNLVLNTSDMKMYYYIRLSTNINGKETVIGMSLTTEDLFCKMIDNRIYIPIGAARKLLPRMGYLCSIDKDNSTLSIKEYDFEKEKEIMCSKFPEEKFDKSIYNTEFDGSFYYDGEYYCDDAFTEQIDDTVTYENRYSDYIDSSYKSIYVVNKDVDTFMKNMLQAACLMHIDDEITVEYDDELEAYVVYNKDFRSAESLDNTYNIIVIRKYDNMVLYRH